MSIDQLLPPGAGQKCKKITCIIDDDGSDMTLLAKLRKQKGVISANSSHCYGSSIHNEVRTKPGKLPQPVLARMIQIVVPESDANDVFDFVCKNAGIDTIGGGVVFQGPLSFGTHYSLPEGVPDEAGKRSDSE